MRSKVCLVILFSVFLAVSSVSAQMDMREGLWEITTKMDMPGMPMSMPSVTHKQCITGDDLVPDTRQPGQECETTYFNVDGNTVDYKIECSSQGSRMTGEGKVTYSGDTMSGSMHMLLSGQEQMEMSCEYTGRRIGNCP